MTTAEQSIVRWVFECPQWPVCASVRVRGGPSRHRGRACRARARPARISHREFANLRCTTNREAPGQAPTSDTENGAPSQS